MGSTNFNQFTIDYYQVYLSISTGAIFISIVFIFFTMASARARGSCKVTVNRDFLLPGLGPGSSEGGGCLGYVTLGASQKGRRKAPFLAKTPQEKATIGSLPPRRRAPL